MDFTYPITIDGTEVGWIEGSLLLGPDQIDPTDWMIEAIWVGHACGTARLTEDHWLYAPLMKWLLDTQRSQINQAWADREREVQEYEPEVV